MKITFKSTSIVAFATLITTFAACSGDDSSNTDPVQAEFEMSSTSAVTATSATLSSEIIDDGGFEILARGMCWSTDENPTIADNKTIDGAGIGMFVSTLTDLEASTLYRARAYATNEEGTSYGEELEFTTLAAAAIPTLTTAAVSTVTATGASSGGTISSDGGAPVTARGVVWSTTQNPTTANQKTVNGTGTGSFTSAITGLIASTTYYVRSYATNSAGTAYGNQLSFATTAAGSITLGMVHEGGIVFYVDATGQHGLVAAPSNQGQFKWGCEGQAINGTSTALGSGAMNTQIIAASCSATSIAAKVCNDLVLNGKSDWYLPSKDELALMHQNLHVTGLAPFSMDRYWSSSQYDANFAWCQFFNNNVNVLWYDKDMIPYSVRAVRTF